MHDHCVGTGRQQRLQEWRSSVAARLRLALADRRDGHCQWMASVGRLLIEGSLVALQSLH